MNKNVYRHRDVACRVSMLFKDLRPLKIRVLLLLLLLTGGLAHAQKTISYTAGIGSRDPDNGDIWILFHGVTAMHEGMKLESDSAHYNTRENSFTAFGEVTITLSDTTFIFGDRLFYDGNTRVVDIWDDTVVLVDGGTSLLANHITYERNQSTAYYTQWGHAVSGARTLKSRQGQYNSLLKQFYIYGDVRLTDTAMLLLTDTLIYNTVTEVAHFESPTTIYTDSSIVSSSRGDYHTQTRYAISYRESAVDGNGYSIAADTLFYDDMRRYGKARSHVCIIDSSNNITCTGRYGETNQVQNYSFVTDSALVVMVDQGDTLYLHADTIFLTTDSANRLRTVRASHRVKLFRHDVQARCDSAFYQASDSTLALFHDPILWYDHYQCTADTIEVLHDTSGIRMAYLRSNCFALQQVDSEKFNQLKGRQGIVYFTQGEPRYADIKGNAQMVYYITDGNEREGYSLVGANVGRGTDIRIYFDDRRTPERVVTYDKPDMYTYPVDRVPDDWKRLKDFRWLTDLRPRHPQDVFQW